ncbi:hypothetical protein [Embleya sp. NPDC050493]|uniref:hypothetical protein n=1 Tax=Embleya sp. NPDC050493 TaxID=3363989 RepID=UPI0037A6AABF
MSRHGSGKRRRTSPDPDDTGAPHPGTAADPASGHVEDAYDAGSPGSGEYDVSPYGSGEYAAYGAETYPRTDYSQTDYAQGDYAQADHEPTQYAQDAYEPARYEPAEYESGGYAAHSAPGGGESYPSEVPPAAGYGASAYDPATDPALMGGTAEFAAVVDESAEAVERRSTEDRPTESRSTERRPAETRDADTGMRPAPPPHEGNIIRLVAVGSLIWFALFVLAWFMRDTLADDDRGWWPWCALAGSGLGLFGLWYCRRLQSADED